MRQKIDIADVETATKIRAKFLRALENEEFGLLPGNTFVKTFLRTYAEPLGLDPQLLLEEYRAEYEPRTEGELQPYSVAARQRPTPRRRPRGPSGPPGPGTALLVTAGVIVAVLAVIGLWGNSSSDSPSRGAQSETTQSKPPQKPKRRQRAPAATATTVKLRVAPTTPTYLCVDRGPGTPV